MSTESCDCLRCLIMQHIKTKCLCDDDPETIDALKLLMAMAEIGLAVASLAHDLLSQTDDERQAEALLDAYTQGFNSFGGAIRMTSTSRPADTSTTPARKP